MFKKENDEYINDLMISLIKLISFYCNSNVLGFKSWTPIPNIKTDVFHLRPYCFCEDEECPVCNEPLFYFYEEGLSVNWYKHLRRGMKIDYGGKEITADVLDKTYRTIINNIKEIYKI